MFRGDRGVRTLPSEVCDPARLICASPSIGDNLIDALATAEGLCTTHGINSWTKRTEALRVQLAR